MASCHVLFLLLSVFCLGWSETVQTDEYDACHSGTPLNPSTVRASSSDKIQVLHLASPLMKCKLHSDILQKFAMYHSGIGFVNINTTQQYSLAFEAYPDFGKNTLLPIISNKNGTVQLDWENYSKVFLREHLDFKYWDGQTEEVAQIDGATFNQFMVWVDKQNETWPSYNLWTVFKSFPDKPLLSSQQCFDWTYSAYAYMSEIGVRFHTEARPKRTLMAVMTDTEPKRLDIHRPDHSKVITSFYETLSLKFDRLGAICFLQSLWQIGIEGKFVIRHFDQYYLVRLHHPYFRTHFIYWPPTKPLVVD